MMAEEKKVSGAIEATEAEEVISEAAVEAVAEEAAAAEVSAEEVEASPAEEADITDKLKEAAGNIKRANADARARKSEQERNQKQSEAEAQARIEEAERKLQEDERMAQLVAEQKLAALDYAQNYRKKLMKDRQKAMSAAKLREKQEREAEEARAREEKAKEIAALLEKEREEARERGEKATALLNRVTKCAVVDENGNLRLVDKSDLASKRAEEEAARAEAEEAARKAAEEAAKRAAEVAAKSAPVYDYSADAEEKEEAARREVESFLNASSAPAKEDDGFVLDFGDEDASESESGDMLVTLTESDDPMIAADKVKSHNEYILGDLKASNDAARNNIVAAMNEQQYRFAMEMEALRAHQSHIAAMQASQRQAAMDQINAAKAAEKKAEAPVASAPAEPAAAPVSAASAPAPAESVSAPEVSVASAIGPCKEDKPAAPGTVAVREGIDEVEEIVPALEKDESGFYPVILDDPTVNELREIGESIVTKKQLKKYLKKSNKAVKKIKKVVAKIDKRVENSAESGELLLDLCSAISHSAMILEIRSDNLASAARIGHAKLTRKCTDTLYLEIDKYNHRVSAFATVTGAQLTRVSAFLPERIANRTGKAIIPAMAFRGRFMQLEREEAGSPESYTFTFSDPSAAGAEVALPTVTAGYNAKAKNPVTEITPIIPVYTEASLVGSSIDVTSKRKFKKLSKLAKKANKKIDREIERLAAAPASEETVVQVLALERERVLVASRVLVGAVKLGKYKLILSSKRALVNILSVYNKRAKECEIICETPVATIHSVTADRVAEAALLPDMPVMARVVELFETVGKTTRIVGEPAEGEVSKPSNFTFVFPNKAKSEKPVGKTTSNTASNPNEVMANGMLAGYMANTMVKGGSQGSPLFIPVGSIGTGASHGVANIAPAPITLNPNAVAQSAPRGALNAVSPLIMTSSVDKKEAKKLEREAAKKAKAASKKAKAAKKKAKLEKKQAAEAKRAEALAKKKAKAEKKNDKKIKVVKNAATIKATKALKKEQKRLLIEDYKNKLEFESLEAKRLKDAEHVAKLEKKAEKKRTQQIKAAEIKTAKKVKISEAKIAKAEARAAKINAEKARVEAVKSKKLEKQQQALAKKSAKRDAERARLAEKLAKEQAAKDKAKLARTEKKLAAAEKQQKKEAKLQEKLNAEKAKHAAIKAEKLSKKQAAAEALKAKRQARQEAKVEAEKAKIAREQAKLAALKSAKAQKAAAIKAEKLSKKQAAAEKKEYIKLLHEDQIERYQHEKEVEKLLKSKEHSAKVAAKRASVEKAKAELAAKKALHEQQRAGAEAAKKEKKQSALAAKRAKAEEAKLARSAKKVAAAEKKLKKAEAKAVKLEKKQAKVDLAKAKAAEAKAKSLSAKRVKAEEAKARKEEKKARRIEQVYLAKKAALAEKQAKLSAKAAKKPQVSAKAAAKSASAKLTVGEAPRVRKLTGKELAKYIAEGKKAYELAKRDVKNLEALAAKAEGGVKADNIVKALIAEKNLIDALAENIAVVSISGNKTQLRSLRKNFYTEVEHHNKLVDELASVGRVYVSKVSTSMYSDVVANKGYRKTPKLSYKIEEKAPQQQLKIDDGVKVEKKAANAKAESDASAKRTAKVLDRKELKKFLKEGDAGCKTAKGELDALSAKKERSAGREKVIATIDCLTTQKKIVTILSDELLACCQVSADKKQIKSVKARLDAEIAVYNKLADEYEALTDDSITKADTDLANKIIAGEKYSYLPNLSYKVDTSAYEYDYADYTAHKVSKENDRRLARAQSHNRESL